MRLFQVATALVLLQAFCGQVSTGQINADPAKLVDISDTTFVNTSFEFKNRTLEFEATSHGRRWKGAPPAPASDAVWEKAKCKGRKFMMQMSLSDHDVGQMLPTPQNSAQSPWFFGHLSPWGYTMPSVGEPYRNLETGGYWGVADLFRHLGFSDKCVEEGGLWRAAVISHYQPRISEQIAPIPLQTYVGPDGYVRRASGAFFYIAVNPQGRILVQNTLGPRSAAERTHPGNFPDNKLPWLQKLSDMMWAMWEYYVPAHQRANLDFIMSLGINNPESLSLIRRALDSEGQALTTNPYRFDPSSDGGLALLGSPNGARVAHFLTQRKPQIGLKTVIGVYAFECLSKSHAPCLMFKLGNLGSPAPRPQADQAGSNMKTAGASNVANRRGSEARSYVRVHTSRYDASGNVTRSSEYV